MHRRSDSDSDLQVARRRSAKVAADGPSSDRSPKLSKPPTTIASTLPIANGGTATEKGGFVSVPIAIGKPSTASAAYRAGTRPFVLSQTAPSVAIAAAKGDSEWWQNHCFGDCSDGSDGRFFDEHYGKRPHGSTDGSSGNANSNAKGKGKECGLGGSLNDANFDSNISLIEFDDVATLPNQPYVASGARGSSQIASLSTMPPPLAVGVEVEKRRRSSVRRKAPRHFTFSDSHIARSRGNQLARTKQFC